MYMLLKIKSGNINSDNKNIFKNELTIFLNAEPLSVVQSIREVYFRESHLLPVYCCKIWSVPLEAFEKFPEYCFS